MALKERFVCRHLFDTDNPLSRFEFDYSIDQQKGIAMRQYPLYLNGVKD